MKRNLLLSFVLMLGCSLWGVAQSTDTSASSQQQPAATTQKSARHHHGMMKDHKMDPQKMLNHLDKELSLTPDEKDKIQTILTNHQQQAEQLRAKDKGDKKQEREQMRQLHENTHAQIRAVLTPDQQQKFDKMMAKHMGMHHMHTGMMDKDTTTTTKTTEAPK